MKGTETRLSRVAAVLVWLPPVAIPLAIGLIALQGISIEGDAWFLLVYVLIATAWGLVGAFLAVRRPANRVGWLVWFVGTMIGVSMLGQVWAYLSLEGFDGALPGSVAGAMLGVLFIPALYLTMLVPLLFPDGRFLSRRWAGVGATLIVLAAMTLLGTVLRPGEIEGMSGYENPLGVAGLAGLAQAMVDVAGVLALGCILAAVISAVLRFRRGTPTARSQLKWFGSAVGVGFSMFFAAALLPEPFGQLAWIGATISLGFIPIAIGIAVLRYRLFEIDRIITRTLGWAIVTGILVAVFAGVVVGLQAVLAPWTANNTLAVAASTLVAAALFQPLRARVQHGVDRRFNRSRVDAERAVASFASHARDEVDLGRLRSALVATARGTVGPSTARLWMRDDQ